MKNQPVRKHTPTDSARLARLRELASALPEIKISGAQHFSFRIAKKTFAWYLYHHHDDGIVALCAKSTRARQQELIAAHPDRYFVPPYVGPSGWVGLRLDRPKVYWDEVLDVLVTAYRLQAPKRLARDFE